MATLTRDHFDCNLFTHHHFAIDTLSHQPRCLKVPLHDISKQTTHPAHRRSRKSSQHLMQTLHQVNSEIKELEDRLAALTMCERNYRVPPRGFKTAAPPSKCSQKTFSARYSSDASQKIVFQLCTSPTRPFS